MKGFTMSNGIPNLDELQKYVVNRQGWEVIRQSFFDSAVYAAAGQPTLSFFSTPIGQGVGFGGGVKTATDTNMTLAGQLPAMQGFLIEAVEVMFLPTTPTVAAAMPAAFGAGAVAVQVNDSYIVRRSGNLNLTIGSKPYLQDGPLMKFPASADFEIDSSLTDATTAAANLQSRIAYAKSRGRVYTLGGAPIFLTANQNFSVTLAWPEGVQAISNPGRIVVTLGGLLYRRSQ
jgi:hypothetical protein